MCVLKAKKTVDFDVENVEHRRHAYNFFKNGKWSEDAPRFAVPQYYSSVPTMMQSMLVNYYLEQEMSLVEA